MRRRLSRTVPGSNARAGGVAIEAQRIALSAACGVEAALRLARPSPAAGALVFAVGDGARARRAADRQVAARDERMFGDPVAREVPGDVRAGERSEGVDTDEVPVLLEDGDVRSRLALIAPQAGDPCARARAERRERGDLVHAAAEVRVLTLDVAAVAGDERFVGDVGLQDAELEA